MHWIFFTSRLAKVDGLLCTDVRLSDYHSIQLRTKEQHHGRQSAHMHFYAWILHTLARTYTLGRVYNVVYHVQTVIVDERLVNLQVPVFRRLFMETNNTWLLKKYPQVLSYSFFGYL